MAQERLAQLLQALQDPLAIPRGIATAVPHALGGAMEVAQLPSDLARAGALRGADLLQQRYPEMPTPPPSPQNFSSQNIQQRLSFDPTGQLVAELDQAETPARLRVAHLERQLQEAKRTLKEQQTTARKREELGQNRGTF
jgi:hypothetical protein